MMFLASYIPGEMSMAVSELPWAQHRQCVNIPLFLVLYSLPWLIVAVALLWDCR